MTDKKKFSARTDRIDPYRNYRFRVVMDGKVVAGMSRVSGVKSGRLTAGMSKFDAITLDRGVTHDKDFESWASGGGEKDLRIELLNETGEVVRRYGVLRARVSEYRALPELDANAGAVGIEYIKVEHEGWEEVEPPH